jgi:hypothetical protein
MAAHDAANWFIVRDDEKWSGSPGRSVSLNGLPHDISSPYG